MDSFDLRQLRTREALKQALVELIGESGFEAISITDICERARLARKTFYAHYADKDALLLDCVEPLLEALVGTVSAADAESLLADNKPLSYPAFRHVQEHAAFYRSMLSAQGSAAFIIYLLDFMTRSSYERHALLREAAPSLSVEPMLIAHFLAGALLNCIIWWLGQDCKPSAETMAYAFSQLAAPGVLQALGMD